MRTPRKLEGQRFGKLKAVSIAYKKNGSYWNCQCDCGNSAVVYAGKLTTGYTQSCGCLVGKAVKHGMSKSPEFGIWENMKTRCGNPNHRWWHRYGGRGIRVCGRWLESFENFVSDMGNRPSKAHTLERVNNNGNYEPSNCIWATFNEQAVNRCSTRMVKVDGISMNLRDAAKCLGIKYNTMYMRIRRQQEKGMV